MNAPITPQYSSCQYPIKYTSTLFIGVIGCLVLLFHPSNLNAQKKATNIGLGPIEIRDQFPVTFPYLSMAPESPSVIPDSSFSYGYQLVVANTFFNSEGSEAKIGRDQIAQGLEVGNFFSDKDGKNITGFRSYVDVESYRHLFRFKYGFWDTFEFGLEIPFVSFVGGSLDSLIEEFHNTTGVDNSGPGGGYRSFSDKNRYDFYVVKDNQFIINSDQQFSNQRGEMVLHAKWLIWNGNEIFPALGVKFAYKAGFVAKKEQEKLFRSGNNDTGTYLFVSKGFGEWFAYFGWGVSNLDQTDREFSKHIMHRFIALEYQLNRDNAFIFQNVSQTSIFPTSGNLTGSNDESASAFLSNSSDLIGIGFKSWVHELYWQLGLVQDYNQFGNATDIVFFWEIGEQW